MKRRSFLSLLGLAPAAGVSVAAAEGLAPGPLDPVMALSLASVDAELRDIMVQVAMRKDGGKPYEDTGVAYVEWLRRESSAVSDLDGQTYIIRDFWVNLPDGTKSLVVQFKWKDPFTGKDYWRPCQEGTEFSAIEPYERKSA